ncbi:Fur-regulated basic protein FbpA [Bacillus sp. ISL-18]|nr:Fur-regulated basic protein FbpA [Bacillus sp. ISL-18]
MAKGIKINLLTVFLTKKTNQYFAGGHIKVENLLNNVGQYKKQYLIKRLIQSGIFKKNNKHLYEWTLTELEEEYFSLKKRKS